MKKAKDLTRAESALLVLIIWILLEIVSKFVQQTPQQVGKFESRLVAEGERFEHYLFSTRCGYFSASPFGELKS